MGKNYRFRILACVIIVIVLTAGAGAAATVSKISLPNASVLYGNPVVYGNIIVWQDNRNGNYALYTYDAISGTESRISFNDVSNQIYPAIYKDNVVYQDDREFFTYDIYLYNITTGVTTQITNDPLNDQITPAVYGSRIVWSDNRDDGVNYQIYTNGTSPGTEFAISPAIGFNQLHPQIYGNLVVWEDYRNSNPDVYLYDLSTRRETRITYNAGSQTNPVVFGNRIAWTDDRNVRNEIFINGTSPGQEYSITPDQPGSDHISPSIYGPKIVWVQDGSVIFMNDTSLSRGVTIPVDTIPGSVPSAPKLTRDTAYGDRVVWEDDQTSREIFMYTEGGPGSCPTVAFTNNYRGGPAPVSIAFTDTSTSGSTNWFWDFGDGTTSTEQNPSHLFLRNTSFDITLTISNPYCRDSKTIPGSIVIGRPAADFIASPATGVVPARIVFNDTSGGFPASWLWDFGDQTPFSSEQNTSHTYTTAGTYTVNLTIANAHGSSFKTGTITVFNGASQIAYTSIDGLRIDQCTGRQSITVDPGIISSSLTSDGSILELRPPSSGGFEAINLYSFDGIGFTSRGGIFVGNITGVSMRTADMFLPGTYEFVNYTVEMSSYPCNATLTTQSWPGATTEDQVRFRKIAEGSNYAYYSGTEFTTRITKTNFPPDATARLFLGAAPTWVAPNNPDHIKLERINDARTKGEVLRTSYLYYDPVKNLDIFEATSPSGLSTFGLSALSGSGNIFQMVTFEIVSFVNPENPGANDNSPSATKPGITPGLNISANVTPTNSPVPEDPGKTAKLYTNPDGVITQPTTLQSTDRRATITLREGTVAKNSTGKPLSSITIKAIPKESVPGSPPGNDFSFGGMAYEILPDGATFSPALSLSFTLPTDTPLGLESTIKTFDRASATWQDLPVQRDAVTGAMTASISHFCCFALFTKSIAVPVSSVTHPTISSTPANSAPSLPPTALGTISGMLVWVAGIAMKNLFITVAIVMVFAALLYFRKRGRKDRLRYLL